MSVEGFLALVGEEPPAGWLQYADGSWCPVGRDGRVGLPIRVSDLLGILGGDLDALEAVGFIGDVIDVDPVGVSDVEIPNPEGGQINRPLRGGGCRSAGAAE